MEIKHKYSKEIEESILQLEGMINSIKDKYDKKIKESTIIEDMGHLQIMYLAEIKPYRKQIQYLIEQSQVEKIEIQIPKIDIDSEMAKQMKSIEEIILTSTSIPYDLIQKNNI
ncbi:hypothetical protein [Clostridium saccharoperbutylacetonicum]|uniref:hypothetical protein n=1 Tax=Clostridium saccharoperbutylacetonicum TaxID=36745 RepID=UPI0039E78FEE